MRLRAAFLTLVAAICFANWTGWGHNYLPLAELVGIFFLARWLPEQGWRWLISALLGFSLAVAALAVVQMWHMDRARGVFVSPNLLGYYAVVMLFLAASTLELPLSRPTASNRGSHGGFKAAGCLAAANLLSLAFSQSRASIIALGAGLFVMLCRRPLYAFLAVGTAMFTVSAIRSSSEQGRAGIWWAGWQAFLHRPLTGWGQGGVFVGGLASFYSVPLDLAVAAGLLGLLAGAWLFIEGMVAARRQPAVQAMLVAWAVNGLFIYGTAATFVPIFLVLGRLSLPLRHPALQDGMPALIPLRDPPAVPVYHQDHTVNEAKIGLFSVRLPQLPHRLFRRLVTRP